MLAAESSEQWVRQLSFLVTKLIIFELELYTVWDDPELGDVFQAKGRILFQN